MSSYRNIEHYRILKTDGVVGMENLVSMMLEQGWQPLGGAIVEPTFVAQTMVLRSDKKKEKADG